MHLLHSPGGLFLALLLSGCALSFPDYGGAGGAGDESGTEDCTNGVDDDNDGLTDCQDIVACGNFVSVPKTPLGYKGPVVLSENVMSFSCVGDWPVDTVNGEANFIAKPASCACTCDPPVGRACAKLTVTGFIGGGCMTAKGSFPFSNNQCTGALSPPWNDVGSAKVVVDPPSGGTCTASTDPPLEPPTIEHRFVCGRNEFGVGGVAGEICVPKPLANVEQRLCVYAAGDTVCPPSVFTERTVLYQGHEDLRACDKPCTCAAPTGGSCAGRINVDSQSSNCSNVGSPIPGDGKCYNASGFNSQRATIDPPVGSTCSPAVRAPKGEIMGTDPTTVCCTLPL